MKSVLRAAWFKGRGPALQLLAPLFPKGAAGSPLPRGIGRILCIRIDRVGDMVLSTPAFEALKAAWPQSRLTVLASPANAPVLAQNPQVDEVILYDRWASLPEKMRRIGMLRSRRFDLAIDLHADEALETAFLAAASGAAHRLGYAAFGREAFFNGPAVPIEARRPVTDALLGLLGESGISSEKAGIPMIYLSADEQEWAKRWLEHHGLSGRNVIAIHPGAHYETQRWPGEYYAELIGRIGRHGQAEVLLLGGPSDAKVVGEILAGGKGDTRACIQDDLRKFLAILSRCRMLVCNNSGPLHCAAALGIPTLSFMGPTVKERWMPLGGGHRVLRRDELPCIGCNSGRCLIETHDCMRLIAPEAAFETLRGELTWPPAANFRQNRP